MKNLVQDTGVNDADIGHTPLDIRRQEFAGALSGYSRQAVRAFLSDLAGQFENMLRERQRLAELLAAQEKRIEAYREGEEELKRTLVSAERITAEMRGSAQKEVELMIREAETEREKIYTDLRVRAAEQEGAHASRVSELEGFYRARQTELEQGYMARAGVIEQEALARRTALENSLSRLRAERAQFLAQYRALLQGFGELARHHEAELAVENGVLGALEQGVALSPEDGEERLPTFSHQM